MGIPGPGQLLIILAIVIVIFGAKRLKNLGSDLGGAVKGFKTAVKEEETDSQAQLEEAKDAAENVVSEEKDENKA